MTKIELLAPAKNAEIGIEAIRHGADAVYIGGPTFGARAAAGNTIEDIERLCQYAHLFGAKVYVTLNTILYDDELAPAEQLVRKLYAVGVDALITQDLALLAMDLPPIPLHASTQMDNCTPEKAKFLEDAGFSQIVLARELSFAQIRAIHEATKLPLEAFVHGALCVSYSGRCYASEYCFKRSANRGRCAQFCRLAFDLVDSHGEVIASDKHLLSLRDMNRSAHIEEMMDAGVVSFKIEGRLKDLAYVKNVTAFYRRVIDEIIERRSGEYARSSRGEIVLKFVPNLEKAFNRGFTNYFLAGRTSDVWNFTTPKAVGEPVAIVKRVGKRSLIIEPSPRHIADDRDHSPHGGEQHADASLHNGDGITFINNVGKLVGFRANKVEGNEVFPLKMPAIQPGTRLYRNEDRVWEAEMAKNTAERLLPVRISLIETAEGYELTATVRSSETLSGNSDAPITCTVLANCPKQAAEKPQQENIKRVLAKLGGTCFVAQDVTVSTQGERFIPASKLTEMRRELINALTDSILSCHHRNQDKRRAACSDVRLPSRSECSNNVSNGYASNWLRQQGAGDVVPAFEIEQASANGILMTCKHCLRYAFGQCPKMARSNDSQHTTWHEPLALRLPDGRQFPLFFDCRKCEMQVRSPRN